jgi:hypothetical protein
MPIAIRHSITYQYLNASSKWVASAQDARDFEDTGRAEEFCVQRQLEDIEILMILPEGTRLVVHLEALSATAH